MSSAATRFWKLRSRCYTVPLLRCLHGSCTHFGGNVIFRSRMTAIYKVFLTALLMFTAGCASNIRTELKGEAFYMDRGMRRFEKKNYEAAIEDFRTVVDSFSGSGIVDKAQFMLGEAHYNNEDYITRGL